MLGQLAQLAIGRVLDIPSGCPLAAVGPMADFCRSSDLARDMFRP
jgi:hypothetical protein